MLLEHIRFPFVERHSDDISKVHRRVGSISLTSCSYPSWPGATEGSHCLVFCTVITEQAQVQRIIKTIFKYLFIYKLVVYRALNKYSPPLNFFQPGTEIPQILEDYVPERSPNKFKGKKWIHLEKIFAGKSIHPHCSETSKWLHLPSEVTWSL